MASVHDSGTADLLGPKVAVPATPEIPAAAVDASPAAAECLETVTLSKKRAKSPGIRVINGRVVDSVNGISCHQCRQKTRDFAASCKQIWKGKPCMINICHKCLMNRYGEKVEEVEKIDNWSCPRCRGVCNCSLCMKKKGHIPTGNLIHAAKATGYTSVHDLLDRNGSDVLSALDGLKSSRGINSLVIEKALKRIRDKENSNEEQKDNVVTVSENGVADELSLEIGNARVAKKLKSKAVSGNSAEFSNNSTVEHAEGKMNEILGMDLKTASEIAIKDGKEPIHDNRKKKPRCPKRNKKNTNKTKSDGGSIFDQTALLDVGTGDMNARNKKLAKRRKLKKQIINTEIDLPKGTPLLEVADTDWQPEDVGPVMQFLEFCNAFSKILDLKDGEPEHLLRDLARGRLSRQVGSSSILRFLTKLFSLIQEDMDEKSLSYSTDSGDSWLLNFVKFVEQPEFAFKKFEFDCFPKDPSAYDTLDISKKLRILNLLCDETLQTEKLRNWMDSENHKYIDKKKEMEKIKSEAKRKGNDLKKKLKDDVAKVTHSVNDGVALSVTEQSNLISEIKEESEKAHAKMLETMGILPKNKQRRDAMRTVPVLWEEEGRVYWDLEGYCSNSKIILQDVGNMSSTVLQDRWFSYNPQEEKTIEQHISSSRRQLHWACKIGKHMADDPALGNKSDDVAGADNHASASGSVIVATDVHPRVHESNNIADDANATSADNARVHECNNVADDHASCCESVNVGDEDHARCPSVTNLSMLHDHEMCCESVSVACDNQARGCEPYNAATPTISKSLAEGVET